MKNIRVVLVDRPNGYPKADNFRVEESAVEALPSNGLIVKNHFLAIDPAMRGWICDLDNYLPPVPIGSVMRSLAVGEVIESSTDKYCPGEFVTGWFGWQQYAAITPDAVIRKVSPEEGSLSLSLGVLGLNGITASLMLRLIGKPKTGETILISTAAGAVGSIAGQLARKAGCHVVGITGADEKVDRCVSEFGYHSAINYKTAADLGAEIAAACPDGVDIFIDSTSGHIADTAFKYMNINGRVIQCGTASVSSWTPLPEAPRRERYILTKRLIHQGFVAFDHFDLWPKVIQELSLLLKSEELVAHEDIRQGLATAPEALENLYLGRNDGKLIVAL